MNIEVMIFMGDLLKILELLIMKLFIFHFCTFETFFIYLIFYKTISLSKRGNDIIHFRFQTGIQLGLIRIDKTSLSKLFLIKIIFILSNGL